MFVGGVGWERGGRLERSRDRVGREEVEEVHERFALKEGNSIISFDFGVVVVVVIIEVVVVEVVVSSLVSVLMSFSSTSVMVVSWICFLSCRVDLIS